LLISAALVYIHVCMYVCMYVCMLACAYICIFRSTTSNWSKNRA